MVIAYLQHIHHILRGDVARGAPGVGAPPEARHGRVHHGHAHLQSRQDVRQRLPVGVVAVHRQHPCRQELKHGLCARDGRAVSY